MDAAGRRGHGKGIGRTEAIMVKCGMYLYQRKGVWYIYYSRNNRISLGTTDEKAALKALAKAKEKALNDKVASLKNEHRTTLAEFIAQYDTWCQDNHKPSTYAREKRIYPKFEAFIQGHTALHAITQRMCEGYVSYLKQCKLSPTSINIELKALKSCFNKAVEWNTTDQGRYIKNSPFRYVRLQKFDKGKPKFIETEDIIDQIFATIARTGKEQTKKVYRLVFALYIYTGARRSEISRIQWKHISETHILFPDRKNCETLTVPIVPRLAAILSEYPRGVGRLIPITIDQMGRRMKYYLREAGMGHLKPHDLRHTFASHLLMAGVDIKTVQRLLGHSSFQATQIYTHLTEEHIAEEIKRLPYGQ